jgi:protein-arginine kinase activator protein McsA
MTALREELSEAIRAEDYERAAAIRDEIRGLEAQVGDDA